MKSQTTKKKWENFEDETHRIVKLLNSKLDVFKDVKLMGKLSESKRQIDVQLINPNKYDFIAFECKDYKRSVDVPKIEAFNTKLGDIGAHKGAIVANSAYSKAAQNMASKLGIDLLCLVNIANIDIRTQLYTQALITETSVSSFVVQIGTSASTSSSFSTDSSKLELADESGNKIPASELFKELWNTKLHSVVEKAGRYEYTIPPKGKKMVATNGEIVELNRLNFVYIVQKKYFLGKVNISKTEGLYNVHEKTFQAKEILTEEINLEEFEKEWKEVAQQDALTANNLFGIEIVCLFKNANLQ